MPHVEPLAQQTPHDDSAAAATVLVKGELHTDPDDLEEAAALIESGVDVLVLERADVFGRPGVGNAWFVLSVGLLAWILDSLYVSKTRLVDLARHHDAEIISTRASNRQPLSDVPTSVQLVSAAGFYTLIPASLWIGFVTQSPHIGSLLLFIGLVAPVVGVRMFNSRRDDSLNRERQITDRIEEHAGQGDRVVAVIGAGHLDAVVSHLSDDLEVDCYPPVNGNWSPRYLRRLLPGTCKAGFVLFSLYISSVWLASVGVNLLSALIVDLLGGV